MDAII
jgi:hypothetical protein